MEAIALIAVIGYVGYLAARERKFFDVKPRINRSHQSHSAVLDHAEYINRVEEENDQIDQESKLRAENAERIKKDFLLKK